MELGVRWVCLDTRGLLRVDRGEGSEDQTLPDGRIMGRSMIPHVIGSRNSSGTSWESLPTNNRAHR